MKYEGNRAKWQQYIFLTVYIFNSYIFKLYFQVIFSKVLLYCFFASENLIVLYIHPGTQEQQYYYIFLCFDIIFSSYIFKVIFSTVIFSSYIFKTLFFKHYFSNIYYYILIVPRSSWKKGDNYRKRWQKAYSNIILFYKKIYTVALLPCCPTIS